MKNHKIFILIILAISVWMTSCKKDEITFDQNPSLHKEIMLNFTDLTIQSPNIMPGAVTRIVATAVGDGLTYHFTAASGTLTVNGNEATYSNTESGTFVIICEVKDSHQQAQTRQVTVHVTGDLVFTSIEVPDPKVPLNMATTLRAVASGDEITYDWSATGGSLDVHSDSATFTAAAVGNYVISCTVKDKNNHTETKSVTIEATDQLIFKSLVADIFLMKVNEISTLTATAYGDELTYEWSSEPAGVLLGSGSQIQFTICHADSFTVSCKVSDKYGNTETKSVVIVVSDI